MSSKKKKKLMRKKKRDLLVQVSVCRVLVTQQAFVTMAHRWELVETHLISQDKICWTRDHTADARISFKIMYPHLKCYSMCKDNVIYIDAHLSMTVQSTFSMNENNTDM